MKDTIAWCYMHCPKDVLNGSVIDVINSVKETMLDKFLIPKTKMDALSIKEMSVRELSSVPASKQYYIIITHILLNDLKNMSVEKVCYLVHWILETQQVFELEWVYYLWHESSICNNADYPAFSMLVDIAEHADDDHIMKFLWNVAKSGDMYITRITKCVADALEASYLTKFIVYTHLCSGVNLDVLYRFFSDMYKVPGSEQELLFYNFYTYYWSRDVMETLVSKKYTISRLAKYINKYANTTVMFPGRTLNVNALPTKLLPVFCGTEPEFLNAPAYRNGTKVDFNFWCKGCVPASEIVCKPTKSVYQEWFESLSKEQLLEFRASNPIVYKACYEGKFNMVKEVLMNMMKES